MSDDQQVLDLHDILRLRATPLTLRQIARAQQLNRIYVECGDDLDFWAVTIGYRWPRF